MTQQQACIQDLNAAIVLANRLKVDIVRGRRKQAIDRIADILFTLGQSLTCINRLEATQTRRTKAAPATARLTRTLATSRSECARLVNLAIDNFRKAKRFILLGRYEDAEDAIAATLTGRILHCVNHLYG